MVQEGRNARCSHDRRFPSVQMEGTAQKVVLGLDGSPGASQIHAARRKRLTLSDYEEKGIWRKPAFRNLWC